MLKKILGMLGLVMGGRELNRLAMAAVAYPHTSTFYNYSRPNQRRQRNSMRRTVFANRHIKRKS